MGVDRRTDDSIDTIRYGRLDRKLATSRLKERGELIWNRPDCLHSISQPGFEQHDVGDGRFPGSQPCSDLGPMTLPGPACRVVPLAIIEHDPRAPRQAAEPLPPPFHHRFLLASWETAHSPGKTRAARRTQGGSHHSSS
jgi:hypothetical protein